MWFTEQFLQNLAVIILIGLIALLTQQPFALLAIMLLGHLPQIQYIDEETNAVGREAEQGEYDTHEMGFLARLKSKSQTK